jgi:hypothetical protein
VIDLTVELEKPTTTDEVRQAFRDAANGRMKVFWQLLKNRWLALISKGPHSSLIDLPLTMVLGKGSGNFAKMWPGMIMNGVCCSHGRSGRNDGKNTLGDLLGTWNGCLSVPRLRLETDHV